MVEILAVPSNVEKSKDVRVTTGKYKNSNKIREIWYMSIDSIKFNERHSKFKDKISDTTYKNLEELYNIEDMQSPDRKMKNSILYIRQCSMIDSLLVEYTQHDDEAIKNIIDYYSNPKKNMQEMNTIGLGWYYDVKFKKNTATLYSVGYGNDSTWIKWLQNKNANNNQIKKNGIRLVFTACKEHINRGGNIRLKSLSKCFGVDLFKYMQLDNNCKANLYIIKDAPVNFIKNNGKEMSLQEYLLSDETFDLNTKPQFCLDFSNPRNEKAENYNNWSKRFLDDKYINSQAEVNEKKNDYGIKSDQLDYVLLKLLKQEHTKGGEKGISSRISPIADKEVIASDTLWNIEDYTPNLEKEEIIKPERCYHFTFDSKEYCQLIFHYFKTYAEKHSKQKFIANYNTVINCERETISNKLSVLREEQEKFDNSSEAQLENEEIEKMKNQYDNNEILIRIYSSYEKFLENTIIKETETPKKIQLALSFIDIDWNSEKIPQNWSMDNIYSVKENNEENLKINLYKCICKRAALMENSYGK